MEVTNRDNLPVTVAASLIVHARPKIMEITAVPPEGDGIVAYEGSQLTTPRTGSASQGPAGQQGSSLWEGSLVMEELTGGHRVVTSDRKHRTAAGRVSAVAALVAGMTFVGSPPAHAVASNALVTDGNLNVSGRGVVDNNINITRSGDLFTITDTGGDGVVEAGPGCQLFPNDGVTLCRATEVTQVRVGLGDGNDTLTTNVATPVLAHGGIGNDTITGGNSSGPMILIGAEGTDTLIGGVNNDTVQGGPGDDALGGWHGNDTLEGGDGNDTFDGGLGNDTLSGGAGHDNMTGGAGSDVFHGGDGTDSVSYRTSQVSVTVLLDNIANDGARTEEEGDNVRDDVEQLLGGPGDDILAGSGAANGMRGGGGADALLGGGGDDVLLGEAGNDFINGGVGNDLIDGSDGVDQLHGSEGDDTVAARDGAQDTTVDGGPGTDTCIVDAIDPRTACEAGV